MLQKARDDTAELLEAKAKQDEEIAQLRSKLEESVEVKDSLEVEVDELRRRMEDEVEKDKEKLCNTEMTVETLQAKVVQLSQCLDKAQVIITVVSSGLLTNIIERPGFSGKEVEGKDTSSRGESRISTVYVQTSKFL